MYIEDSLYRLIEMFFFFQLMLFLGFRDLFQRLLHQRPDPEDDVGGHDVHRPVPENEIVLSHVHRE